MQPVERPSVAGRTAASAVDCVCQRRLAASSATSSPLQQLRVALLLLPGAPLQARHELAPDQSHERVVHAGEIGERVHALGCAA